VFVEKSAVGEAGVFGAPSLVLPSSEIFWGQNRLEMLERALKQLA
jgi:2-hydroxychromene-2-carboxylate isomerase